MKSSWIIVVLPLLSFFVILLFGKRMPRGGAEVGIVAVLIGFVLSLIVASHFWGGNNGAYEAGITWINFGSFKVQLSEHVDEPRRAVPFQRGDRGGIGIVVHVPAED